MRMMLWLTVLTIACCLFGYGNSRAAQPGSPFVGVQGTNSGDPGPWGPDAVWPQGRSYPTTKCPAGSNEAVCVETLMRNSGASAQAIAFARALGFHGYLILFQDYGRVDRGAVLYPFLANDNEQPVLLNGIPAIISVQRETLKVNLRSNPQLAALVSGNRFAGLSDVPPTFIGEEAMPGGGQRFVYRARVSTCSACQPLARPELAFDFAPHGQLVAVLIVAAGIGR